MDEQVTPRNRTARVAGIVAVAAWPVGLFLGWAFGLGQDAAGTGMAIGLGVIAAAAVSAAALIVYLFARSPRRMAGLAAHRAKFLMAIGLVLVLPIGSWLLPPIGEQIYSITVRNLDSGGISRVTVTAGTDTATFRQIEGGQVRSLAGFKNRPPQVITLSWVDAAGEALSDEVMLIPAAPDRFDNGNLHVNIARPRKCTAIFLLPAR